MCKYIFDMTIIYFELPRSYFIAERGRFYLNDLCPSVASWLEPEVGLASRNAIVKPKCWGHRFCL